MSEVTQNPPAAEDPPHVPRWLVRTIWFVHRATYSITRGRFGLRPSSSTQWGMLRLTSVGRRSGKTRVAIVGYIVDGPNLVVPAMNGWADPEPAWWLNLQASPNTSVELPDGRRRDVTARAAVGRGARPTLGAVPRSQELGLHRRECGPPLPRDGACRAGASRDWGGRRLVGLGTEGEGRSDTRHPRADHGRRPQSSIEMEGIGLFMVALVKRAVSMGGTRCRCPDRRPPQSPWARNYRDGRPVAVEGDLSRAGAAASLDS